MMTEKNRAKYSHINFLGLEAECYGFFFFWNNGYVCIQNREESRALLKSTVCVHSFISGSCRKTYIKYQIKTKLLNDLKTKNLQIYLAFILFMNFLDLTNCQVSTVWKIIIKKLHSQTLWKQCKPCVTMFSFFSVACAAQRKNSLSESWMAGSERRYVADRKASLWAYLHGAGTRMVPGQFQYKWHILKVSLVRTESNNVRCIEELFNNKAKHEDEEVQEYVSLRVQARGTLNMWTLAVTVETHIGWNRTIHGAAYTACSQRSFLQPQCIITMTWTLQVSAYSMEQLVLNKTHVFLTNNQILQITCSCLTPQLSHFLNTDNSVAPVFLLHVLFSCQSSSAPSCFLLLLLHSWNSPTHKVNFSHWADSVFDAKWKCPVLCGP